MVRFLAFLVGAAFAAVLAWAFFWTVEGLITDPAPKEITGAPKTAESEFHLHPRDAGLQSAGIFGTYDKQQLQRGYLVYKEVCRTCHSLRFVAFRDLEGLGYNPGQVKTLAAEFDNIPAINKDTGEATTRKGVPADRFPLVYPNEIAAQQANGGAVPPDLSYITRARHGGADYVYSILTGYRAQSAEMLKKYPDVKTPQGKHANPYFAALNIAMPPPLTQEGQVQYTDGHRATVDQMAKDVAAFLVWTADPNLERRHQAGFAAVIFLLIGAGLAFGAYRNVWRDVKH